MNAVPDWWKMPRRVAVVVDNDSWVVPYAEDLVRRFNAAGDDAAFCRRHGEIGAGAVAFYLGCTSITPPAVLARNRRNLVVHASDLPKGRGFSPLTWLILEGADEVPVCLLEAADEADAGAVVYRDRLRFQGHELIDEMRAAVGVKSVELCRRFMAESAPPPGTPQHGQATRYPRRRPADSRLDPELSLAAQFDLLRVVDNARYPAFFDLRGHRYRLHIDKVDE